MQLQGYEDGHFSVDQEAYVDELVRAYQLGVTNRAKIVCPKEILMQEANQVQPFDEGTVKAAQTVAGECLWLSQRTRIDIAFATTVLCSGTHTAPLQSDDLHNTKNFKLHLKPVEDVAPLRVFTDASFAPLGQHSYGGHVVEVKGVPVLWKASRQQLIALSSSEAELIQAVEGSMYAESLMTILSDLGLHCTSAELCLDNTAAISFVNGAGSQRTRHLKVRGYKVRQLIQSGWKVLHCPGEVQKADLLTKVLPSARMQFLCGLLQLRGETLPDAEEGPAVRSVGAVSPSLATMLAWLQICGCCGEPTEDGPDEGGVAIEGPWELAVLTILIVLSTLFLWEAAGAPCRRRRQDEPQVRAVTVHKERRAKKLQGRVAAAIDAVMSERPTGDELRPQPRKIRNKCTESSASSSSMPTVVYGGINMNVPSASSASEGRPTYNTATPVVQHAAGEGSGSAVPVATRNPARLSEPGEHQGLDFKGPVWEPRAGSITKVSSSVQTDPVIVLDPGEYVYVCGGGDCVHRDQDCHGLRRAFNIKPKAICQYCLNHSRRVR